MDFVLSDDFCRKHFLVGILLREVKNIQPIQTLQIPHINNYTNY